MPVITMRHYSKFVVHYLVQLLEQHKVTETTMMNKPVVDLTNFITIQDTVFIVANQINKEYARYFQHYLQQYVNSICLYCYQDLEAVLPRPESHLCCWLQEPRDVPRVVAEAVHPVHAGPGAGHPRPPGLLSGLHPRSHGPLAPAVHQQSDTKCTTDSISW